jgi:two-component system, cell cycle sensor histidine kinase and response regulator CckA
MIGTQNPASRRSSSRIGPRILVVEDMAIVAVDIEATLTDVGYDVVGVVATGADAIERAAGLRPDLVLMDISLGGEVDGIKAAAWVRTHLRLPVIFVTAYADSVTLERAKIAEPFGYIVKPINTRELLATIEVALYRNQLDLAAAESEARYSAVMQQSAECILLVDMDGGRIIESNPEAQKLLGYSDRELEALTLYDVVDADHADVDRSLAAAGSAPPARAREISCRRVDGQRVPVEASAKLIKYGGAEVVCIVARDVTWRHQTEASRCTAQEEQASQRALGRRSERLRCLGEMAAGMAHELDQPLVGVRGLAEHLLLSLEGDWQSSPDKIRQRLQMIIDQADRMDDVIKHVRQFSHQWDCTDRALVQVNEVAVAALRMVRAQFCSHGIELMEELAPESPLVLVNQFCLEEVVLNLLTNARDAVEAVPDGGARRISLRTAISAGAAIVEVEDSGKGMDAEALAHISDPLFTTGGHAGLAGMGLASSRSIAAQIGGDIKLESTPNQGTRVTLHIPASD